MSVRQSAYRKSYGPDGRGKASSVSSVNTDRRQPRDADKTKLKKCNNRLMNYIEKVHDLEETNKILAAQNELLKNSDDSPQIDYLEAYDDKLKRLREKVEELTVKNAKLDIKTDNLSYDLKEANDKLEEERDEKKCMEKEVKGLRKDVDDATIERVGLENKTENLQETLQLGRQAYAVEMENLSSQIKPVDASLVEYEPSILPDLNDAVSDVRKYYEDFSNKNLEIMDAKHKEEYEALNNSIKDLNEYNKNLRDDNSEQKKRIHELEMLLELERPKVEKLRERIDELEDDRDKKNHEDRDRIEYLEKELGDTKLDIGDYSKHCQELNDLNSSLENEILVFQKLLSAEETRILDVEVADPKSILSKDKERRSRSGSRSRSRSRSRSKSRSRSRSRSSSSSRSSSDAGEKQND